MKMGNEWLQTSNPVVEAEQSAGVEGYEVSKCNDTSQQLKQRLKITRNKHQNIDQNNQICHQNRQNMSSK